MQGFQLPFSLDRAPGNWCPTSMPDQSGRVHMITGGTSGLGFQAAKLLAQKNAHVVIAARVQDNIDQAAQKIRFEVGTQKHIDTLILDVSSFRGFTLRPLTMQSRGVQEAVEAWARRDLPLHCLVNNAGVSLPPDKWTPEGLEITQATNLLGPFYLTHLLLPWLAAAPPSRAVFVTSLTEAHGSVDWGDVRGRGLRASDYRAYARSKLSLNMAAWELQRRLRTAAPGVDVLLAQPGLAASGGASRADAAKFAARATDVLGRVLAQSGRDGAKALCHAATAPELEGHGGGGIVHGPLYAGIPYRFLGLFGILTINWPKLVAQPLANPLARDAGACRRMYDELITICNEFASPEAQITPP